MAAAERVQGHCEPRFEAVRQAFQESFDTGYEVGASLAITLDGKPVVDLWGGYADKEKQRPWQEDTIVNVFSTTKGPTAMCALQLMEEGKLDIDAPVAHYWPEFAQKGKENLPVRFLLNHQAGLVGVAKPLPQDIYYHWDQMVEALAEQEPWWEPGTKHGYHAVTFGFLVGEVVRRISGQTLGAYFKAHFADPLGLDFHIGLTDEQFSRTADMIPLEPAPLPDDDVEESWAQFFKDMMDPKTPTGAAFLNPLMTGAYMNTPEWRRAEIPAANGHGTAMALARLYGALSRGGEVDGVRVLSPATIERARQEESFGLDAVITPFPMRFGLGFMLSHDLVPMGPIPDGFGHGGLGGSLAFADLDEKVGFGFVMNKAHEGVAVHDGAMKLSDTFYSAL